MEYFHFSISNWFVIFETNKAVTLVFYSRTVKETTDAEESGLFGHLYSSTF